MVTVSFFLVNSYTNWSKHWDKDYSTFTGAILASVPVKQPCVIVIWVKSIQTKTQQNTNSIELDAYFLVSVLCFTHYQQTRMPQFRQIRWLVDDVTDVCRRTWGTTTNWWHNQSTGEILAKATAITVSEITARFNDAWYAWVYSFFLKYVPYRITSNVATEHI